MTTAFRTWAGITFIGTIAIHMINEVIIGCENGAQHLTFSELPVLAAVAFLGCLLYYRESRQ